MNENTRNELILYFVLAFLISWILWVPSIVISNLFPTFAQITTIIVMAGSFGPTVAAIILSFRRNGTEGIIELLKRGIQFRIGWKWYFPIFLIFPLVVFSAFAVGLLLSGNLPSLLNIGLWITAILMLIIVLPFMLLGGPLGEEWGWRGYALDRLQKKWNGLISSLILCAFWAVWHVPLFFIAGSSQRLLLDYVPFVLILQFSVTLLLITILFTWLHNVSGGSVLVAILLHTVLNTTNTVFMVLAFFPFGLTDPSQLSTINQATLNALAGLITLSSLFVALFMAVVVGVVIAKWGVNLGRKEQVGTESNT